MPKIIVIGLGAMGASLAEALNTHQNYIVYGYDLLDSVSQKAVSDGVIQQAISCNQINNTSVDLIILATPPTAISELLSLLDPQQLILDLASVKTPIMQASENYFHFVGGHPMVGTEKKGYGGRHAVNYRSANFFLMGKQSDINHVIDLLEPIHSHFIQTTAKVHDENVAMTSDMPHIVADALVAAVIKNQETETTLSNYVGPGFRDTTRIAGANPELWSQILHANRDATYIAVTKFLEELQKLQEALSDNDPSVLTAILTKIQNGRRTLL